MTAAVEFTPPALSQPLLRAVLRGGLRLLFRSLVRPPMPIALQRGLLRVLTAATPTPRGLSLTPGQIGGRPWSRPCACRNWGCLCRRRWCVSRQ